MADIELARAYVEIIPTTKGISKKAQEEMFPGTSAAAGAGKKAGKSFSDRLGSVLKKSAIGVGIAAGGLLSATLVKGFGRLSAIETAEAKLTGLGNSAEDVAAIMDNALGAVKGTAFGMDEAATTAASAVAAGIKPGQELESYLRLVGDAATIAGTDMSSMGSIFNKVATSGKVQGDVFAQLRDAGIPIVTLLAEELGVTAGEVYKMGAAGEIGTEQFLAAMSSMSGAALEGGNTTTGAFKNMGAALGRFGAKLLSGVFPLIGPFFGVITEAIDQATSAVGPAIEKITPSLQAVAGAALDTMTKVIGSIGGIAEVIRTGDFNPANWADGVEEDSPIVGFAFRVRDVWQDYLVPFVDWVKGAWPTVMGVLGGVGAALGIAKVGTVVGGVLASLSGGAGALVTAFGNGGLAGVFALVSGAVSKALPTLAKFAPMLRVMFGPVGLIVTALGYLIATNEDVRSSFLELGEVLFDAIGTILSAIAPVIAEVAAAIVPLAVTIAKGLAGALAAAAPVVAWLVGALADLISWLEPVLPLILGVAAAVVVGVKVFGAIGAIISGLIGPIMGIVSAVGGVITVIIKVAKWVKAAALAFTAFSGPIGWIVLGVAALGVALWAFFTKTEKGRELWAKIWGGIKSAVAVVVDWIMGTAWPAIQSAWDAIAAGALWLYQSALLPAWNGIRAAIGAVAGWITGTLWPAMVGAWEAIAAGATWLYRNVIQPVWNGIKLAIAVVVTAVLLYVEYLVFMWRNVLAPVAMWLWRSVITPAWNGIRAAISAVASWIVNVAWPLIKSAWDAIAAAAQWLWRSVLVPAWNGIRTAIAVVAAWIMNVAWPLIKRAWDAVAGAAMWLWNSVLKPAWAGIQAAIAAVVAWLRDTAWPLIQRVIDWIGRYFAALKLTLELYWRAIQWAISTVASWFRDTAWPLLRSVIDWIKTAFNVMRDALKAAWEFVRNRVIQPVIAWFRDTAWPTIRNVIDRVKDGFNTMRDRVRDAWDFVKNRAIKPVADWLTGTLKPKIDEVTGNIRDAFETMKEGIKKAWDAIKDAARTPVRFLVEDVYMETLRATFNGVADKLSLPEKWRLPARHIAFAGGGVMPGYTPGRDVHQFYSPTGGRLDLSGGEAIMRPEWTRAVGGPAAVAEMNRRARRGEAFKNGGVWGALKGLGGDAWDWLTDQASTIAEAVTDPFGVLTKLAGKVAELIPGGGLFTEVGKKVSTNAGTMLGDWLREQLAPVSTDAGPAPAVAGRGGGSLALAGQLARQFGLTFTSGYRRGARTRRTGSVSYHALERAHDYAAPMTVDGKRRMMNLFNALHPYKPTELLYSPAGNRQWRRWGAQAQTSGSTYRGHFNHVHVAFKRGGVFEKLRGGAGVYDQGGWLPPGGVGVNLSNRPEPVFTGAQWDLIADGIADQRTAAEPTYQFGDIHGYTADEVMEAADKKRRRQAALHVY